MTHWSKDLLLYAPCSKKPQLFNMLSWLLFQNFSTGRLC